ncbi:MAG: Na+:solute symporter [Melioribacteraceae bacterium]|nr:Na+:solute symporter [Melioribacteraceae bacterium]MCF8263126.1 Na+:solute symporter [Melioribacteraceae bacterium]MCF8430542.1 Na+:solute symporter [Melioribacteraceae bacterium]
MFSFWDIVIIVLFFVVVLGIGVWSTKKAGKSSIEFFLSGRNMPWWLLGVSMVAATFSADTPNLVTDIVRNNGVAGNWVWWAFLLTGMLTVFVYAKLWRRSDAVTDLEFYEIRYGGKMAAFLRGFRSIYLGLFFNVMIMGTVSLAAIKIGQVMFGIDKFTTIALASFAVVIYATLGGLRGVIFADFFQFGIAMFGSVAAAYYAISQPEVGSLSQLFNHEAVRGKLSLIPDFNDPAIAIPIFIIPIAVQWWSVWYPGAEPGGGGYVVQRMLSAKDEKNAVGATFLFNIAHYAIRPWPWIIVALSSLIIFPELSDIQSRFPEISNQYLKDDIAYPAMMTLLPSGFFGLVVASLIAAYMSTIGTHLNWGASYIVNDFYKRFVNPSASEKTLVKMGRYSTVLLMILAAIVALWLENAKQAFDILLQIGAGTGLIFILRWFWWRINAFTEISAMVVSFLVAVLFKVIIPEAANGETPEWYQLSHWQLVIGIVITTTTWLTVTFLTKPEDEETLKGFVKRTRPGGIGWKNINAKLEAEGHKPIEHQLALEIFMMIAGITTVYSALMASGFWLYGNVAGGLISSIIAVIAFYLIFRSLGKLKFS